MISSVAYSSKESQGKPGLQLSRIRLASILRWHRLKPVLLVADEAAAVIFLASPEQDGEHGNGYDFEAGDGPLIADAVAQRVLDGVCGRGQQNPELIRKTGHQAARGVRGQLVQVHRDYTPSTLHSCLHQESGQNDERKRLA